MTLDVFNEPTLVLPKLQESMAISFHSDGPLVLDSAPVVEDPIAAEV